MTTPNRAPLPMVSTDCACCSPAPDTARVSTTSSGQVPGGASAVTVTGAPVSLMDVRDAVARAGYTLAES